MSNSFNDEDEDLEEQVDVAIDMVNRRLSDFEGRGSGWRLHGIDRVAIQCSKHSPITGSSYIPTPKFIESRRAIVNVKNTNDDFCFLYSVLAHIHPIDRNQRPNQVYHYTSHSTQTRLFRPYISIENSTNQKIRRPKSTHFHQCPVS